jgi:hypothetical protein
MDVKTLIKISLDNNNKINNVFDLTGIEEDQEGLRLIHSMLDELKERVLEKIRKIDKDEELEEDEFEF